MNDPDSMSDASDDSEADQKRMGLHLMHSGEAKTISQIKRSRIDLHKRYIFLCPTQLNKHFDTLPMQAKEGALLVFRCSRGWLFNEPAEVRSARTEARIDVGQRRSLICPDKAFQLTAALSRSPSAKSIGHALYRSDFSRDFLSWVLTKEREGCVFWYKPAKDLDRLSQFFEEKIDPMTEKPYRPLLLDPQWWRVKFTRTSARFCNNPNPVVSAINEFLHTSATDRRDQAIDTLALQELLYQSNPTVEPIVKWPHAPSMRFLPRGITKRHDYVGQETNYRGYIDHSCVANATAPSSPSRHRVTKWPASPRDRYDDLHTRWQAEEASFMRRQTLAMHGARMVSTGAMTAR